MAQYLVLLHTYLVKPYRQAGDSAITTATVESYTLSLPSLFSLTSRLSHSVLSLAILKSIPQVMVGGW